MQTHDQFNTGKNVSQYQANYYEKLLNKLGI